MISAVVIAGVVLIRRAKDASMLDEMDPPVYPQLRKSVVTEREETDEEYTRRSAGRDPSLPPLERVSVKEKHPSVEDKISHKVDEVDYQQRNTERDNICKHNRRVQIYACYAYGAIAMVAVVFTVIAALVSSGASKGDVTTAFNKAVSGMTNQIAGFRNEMESGFEQLNKKFEIRDQRLGKLEGVVFPVQTQTNDQPAKLAEVQIPSSADITNILDILREQRDDDMSAIADAIVKGNREIKDQFNDVLGRFAERLEKIESRPMVPSVSNVDPADYVKSSVTPSRISGTFTGPAGGGWFGKPRVVTITVTAHGPNINSSHCEKLACELHEKLAGKFSRKDPNRENQELFRELAQPVIQKLMADMGYKDTEYLKIAFSNENNDVSGSTNLTQHTR